LLALIPALPGALMERRRFKKRMLGGPTFDREV